MVEHIKIIEFVSGFIACPNPLTRKHTRIYRLSKYEDYSTTTTVKPFAFHLLKLPLLLLFPFLILGLRLGDAAFPHPLAPLHMRITQMFLFIKVHVDVDRLRLVHEFAHQLCAPELVHGPHKTRVFLELDVTYDGRGNRRIQVSTFHTQFIICSYASKSTSCS